MLKLENVSKIYTTNRKSSHVSALNNINVSFGKHGLVSIVGKSGSGKTTLLNILGGIDKPTNGTIVYNGNKFSDFRESDYNNYRNNEISFIFQDYNLLHDYTVIENIKIACRIQGKIKKNVNEIAYNCLKSVGLEDLADRKIESLSGGQQQRVAIARALAKESKIILCDEPTGNLDSNTSRGIFELLKEISKKSLVIIVTHDRELSSQYADRMITLSDGKIIEDEVNNEIETQEIFETNRVLRKKRLGAISIKDTMLMIFNNFKKSIIGNLFILVLLIASISLTTVFMSLSNYNSQDAIINTLKQNEQGVVQITKYIDYPREEIDPVTNEKYIEHGPVIFYEGANIEDLDYLEKLTEGKAGFYPSYFFNKNLQDFTDKFIYTDQTAFKYEALSFREIISVDDFSTFNMRIKFGQCPKADDEVLIYDYMANSLLHYGVFEGDMQGLIGKSLKDRDTNLSMKIAGILQSDYEVYSYIAEDNNAHNFEQTYLTGLQSIFCKPYLIEEIVKEKDYDSIFKCYFGNDKDLIDTDIKKIKNINIENLSFLATIDNFINERGAVVDKRTVARIMHIGVEEVTKEVGGKFLSEFQTAGIKNYYDFSFERNYLSSFAYRIIGISNDDLEQSVLNWYTPNSDDLYMANSEFRQFYLALGNDWKENKKILNKFTYLPKSDEFYEQNPNYHWEGYTDYISYGLLIRDADFYLLKVQEFSRNIMIVLICISAVGICFFASFTIKKYSYKIGVLKSMGARNFDIVLIFGMQIILISIIGYLISIPFSYLFMASINSSFIAGINPSLVFFALDPSSVGLMLIFSLLAVLIATIGPLFKLYKQSPSAIIRKNPRH